MEELSALGARLKAERLQRNETQKTFAARIGVSIPTLNKMENGAATVAIGHWVAALQMLSRTDDIQHLLAPHKNLFMQYKEQQQAPGRQRASRKRL
ncbi:MAG: helix-turn-helix transcriptional regulator [Trichlorobacter sp.]|nr:helix-turn-helix transcriptional regulator [Trichlorobacter sp.]